MYSMKSGFGCDLKPQQDGAYEITERLRRLGTLLDGHGAHGHGRRIGVYRSSFKRLKTAWHPKHSL